MTAGSAMTLSAMLNARRGADTFVHARSDEN